MKESVITYSLRSASYYLSPKQRRQTVGQLGLLLVSSVLDVFGLASLVPVLLVASEPGGAGDKGKGKHRFFVKTRTPRWARSLLAWPGLRSPCWPACCLLSGLLAAGCC